MNYKLKKINIIFIVILLIFLFPMKKVYGTNGKQLAQEAIDAPLIDITVNKTVDIHTSHTAESFAFIDGTDYYAVTNIKTNPSNTSQEYGDLYLVNASTQTLYKESAIDRHDHSDSMTYDPKENYVLVWGRDVLTAYKVDTNAKKFEKVKVLPDIGGVSIGHDVITDKFVTYTHVLKVYSREQFYEGNNKNYLKRLQVPGIKENLVIRQAGEAFANYYYCMFSIHEAEFSFAGNRNIRGNSIAVINLETGEIEKQLYCGDDSEEYQEIDFDSEGNLYINNCDGDIFKTNYNAYAEGNVSATPSNWLEGIVSIVTEWMNIVSDWLQSLMESLETEEDFSQINLTYPASQIMENESLQNILQVENIEDENQNGSNQKEEKNIKIDKEIKSKVDNKKGEEVTIYSNQTPIPSIKVSIDSACANKLSIFDVNFLDASNKNTNQIWNLIKNVVYVSARITLYLCVILLIGIIIFRSILLAMSTMGYRPEKAAESKKMIDNFVTAVLIIVFIYVIIQLGINFYNIVVDFIVNKMTEGIDTPYLYRVKVEDAYYFNTNWMSYFKYKTLSLDIWGAFGASFWRLIVTAIQLFICVFFGLRTVLIGALIVLAPVTAINFLANRVPTEEMGFANVLFLKNFFKVFMIALWLPVVILLVFFLFSIVS